MLDFFKKLVKRAPSEPTEEELRYKARVDKEIGNFRECLDVHELPPIFHYWSNKHLAPPKFHPFGIRNPEQFFFLYTSRYHEKYPDKKLLLVSLGSGNCDMEARLAKNLVEAGITDFSIDCVDINPAMLQRGRELALAMGVAGHINPVEGDFNAWQARRSYDIVIANQSLHHVMNLEGLFAAVRDCLDDKGYFLVNDMIGRNGHQRWPEALALVNEFWKELPDSYRYNQMIKRHEPEYINHDCSTESFEGIRAQDILPLLVENFHFELFLPHANIILVFIDRPFGHNFNAEAQWDRDFIDRVHRRDDEAMLSGEIKPTQLIAALCKYPVETQLLDPRLTPQFCIRVPDREPSGAA